MTIILQPLPLQPLDDATPEAWKAFVDAQWLRRQIEREDASDAAVVAAAAATAEYRAHMAANADANLSALKVQIEWERMQANHRLMAEILERRVTDRTASGVVAWDKCVDEARQIYTRSLDVLASLAYPPPAQTPAPIPAPAPAPEPAPSPVPGELPPRISG